MPKHILEFACQEDKWKAEINLGKFKKICVNCQETNPKTKNTSIISIKVIEANYDRMTGLNEIYYHCSKHNPLADLEQKLENGVVLKNPQVLESLRENLRKEVSHV